MEYHDACKPETTKLIRNDTCSIPGRTIGPSHCSWLVGWPTSTISKRLLRIPTCLYKRMFHHTSLAHHDICENLYGLFWVCCLRLLPSCLVLPTTSQAISCITRAIEYLTPDSGRYATPCSVFSDSAAGKYFLGSRYLCVGER